MLVLVIAVRAVQVPVVDVVEVSLVNQRDVAAARSVDVLVTAFVDVMLVAHGAQASAPGGAARRLRTDCAGASEAGRMADLEPA